MRLLRSTGGLIGYAAIPLAHQFDENGLNLGTIGAADGEFGIRKAFHDAPPLTTHIDLNPKEWAKLFPFDRGALEVYYIAHPSQRLARTKSPDLPPDLDSS